MLDIRDQTKPNSYDQLRCPDCDSLFDRAWEDVVLERGNGEDLVKIPARLPIYTCKNSSCQLQTMDEEGIRLETEAICAYYGVLSPREIKEIRKKHNMTRAEFSDLTGIGESTLGRWERGALRHSRANDKFLRLLMNPQAISWLESQRNLHSTSNGRITDFQNIRLELRDSITTDAKSFELT